VTHGSRVGLPLFETMKSSRDSGHVIPPRTELPADSLCDVSPAARRSGPASLCAYFAGCRAARSRPEQAAQLACAAANAAATSHDATISRPSGIKATGTSLKLATTSGIPMTVMHSSTPVIA